MPKTMDQVKREFGTKVISFSDWACTNNFSFELIYQVLKMNRIFHRISQLEIHGMIV